MNINAAPRTYTSNIVADADLNLEGYNVTANALYSKDNYLLTMLDYGEAFPTDVKEGDKLFAWGEDSTKSYIYTYKQGAWDAGVKPQHMQDYYIADENRFVKFYLVRPSLDYAVLSGIVPVTGSDYVNSSYSQGLILSPDVYLIGSVGIGCCYAGGSASSTDSFTIRMLSVFFTDSTSKIVFKGDLVSPDSVTLNGLTNPKKVFDVSVPSKVNSFSAELLVTNSTGIWTIQIIATYELDL